MPVGAIRSKQRVLESSRVKYLNNACLLRTANTLTCGGVWDWSQVLCVSRYEVMSWLVLALGQIETSAAADIYVFCCSYAHAVAPNGKWVAFVSTTVETSNPEAELAAGLALLGPVEEKFTFVSDVHEPLETGEK